MNAGGWHRVDPVDVPAEGRVRSVTVDGRTVALARCGAQLGALENRCPHQGGPLGEGSIENGWLRCPWHGYDYDPLTGRPPEGVPMGSPHTRWTNGRTVSTCVFLPSRRAHARWATSWGEGPSRISN